MENDNTTKSSAVHTVKRGVVYVELDSGRLTRNYVVLGGKRVYVDAEEGEELTAVKAKKRNK